MMTDETVREVCAEMQDARHLSKSAIEDGNHLLSDWYYDDECQGWLSYFSNRLLSAYEREMAEKDAEIARLKAALKPVMECDPNEDINHTIYEWGLRNSNAVREAKRVMREGGYK